MNKPNEEKPRFTLRTRVRAGDNPGMGPYASEVRSRTVYIVPTERPIPA